MGAPEGRFFVGMVDPNDAILCCSTGVGWFTLSVENYNANEIFKVMAKRRVESQRLVEDLTELVVAHESLLSELAADNAANGLKVIRTLRANIEHLYQQNAEMCKALGVDNWYNGVRRAQSLVNKSSENF